MGSVSGDNSELGFEAVRQLDRLAELAILNGQKVLSNINFCCPPPPLVPGIKAAPNGG